ncbi:MAG: Na+/H+ antiporter NhaA [Bdellovibrionales bacterium]|nr:Na+/H+ antiporter NhaA [Bdellovibrionales bacterium]
MSSNTHHKPRHRGLEILQEFSIPLISGVILAVIWANLDPHGYHHAIHWSPFGAESHFNFHFLMNDLFMVLFFGLAAKEIAESVLPGGALNPIKKAVNPLLGTLGGVLGPIAVYFAWVSITGDASISKGWGIPTATDIALAWLVARLVFGKGHPAVSFLLLLAVADDAIGLGIIAVFYPDPNHPVAPQYIALVGLAMGAAHLLRKKGVLSYWPYLLGPGVVSWLGLYLAHLHPALALVPIVPFMPHAARDEGLFAENDDADHYHDTMNLFEHELKLFVDIGLLGFGLANAGVEFSSMGNATMAVLMGLVIGKTVGIFSFSMIGQVAGFPLPQGMNWRSLLTAGFVGALGLTVALFVSGVAFTDPTLQGSAKMGALLSAFVAPLAFLVGKLLRVRDGVDLGASETEVIELSDTELTPAYGSTEGLHEESHEEISDEDHSDVEYEERVQ